MDITEIPSELKVNNSYIYLFNNIENKEANMIYKNQKLALGCNGYPEEIGSYNGKEFKYSLFEN